MKTWGWLVTVLLLGGMLLAGCGDDEGPADPGGQEDPPVFTDPDVLVAALVAVYEEMDPELFPWLVHPEARFIILPETLAAWQSSGRPLTGGSFDRDTLLTIHENLFGGQTGLDPGGNATPPVDAIAVELMTQQGPWEPIPDGDEDFGTFAGGRALYGLIMDFDHPDSFRHRIQIAVEIFVAEVEISGESGWQILGWRQLGQMKSGASESTDWCEILAMYR